MKSHYQQILHTLSNLFHCKKQQQQQQPISPYYRPFLLYFKFHHTSYELPLTDMQSSNLHCLVAYYNSRLNHFLKNVFPLLFHSSTQSKYGVHCLNFRTQTQHQYLPLFINSIHSSTTIETSLSLSQHASTALKNLDEGGTWMTNLDIILESG